MSSKDLDDPRSAAAGSDASNPLRPRWSAAQQPPVSAAVLPALFADEELENEQQFVAIMQAFGAALLQPHAPLVRQVLETLQALHSKWKLFHRVSLFYLHNSFLFSFKNLD